MENSGILKTSQCLLIIGEKGGIVNQVLTVPQK